jgi:lipoprotein-releasing system ATP-binding protein
MTSVIQAVHLTRIYQTPASRIVIFDGLDLEVREGQMIAVIGPSGAGKSTLMHLLGGLDRPTSGEVLFRGENIFALGPERLAHYRNRHIGFVFQFHHLLPEFTALENAAMPLLIRGIGRSEAREPARGLLERVGLGTRLDHQVGELSGGEQQRVAIARALVGGPTLLLADEPTGNLDLATGQDVFGVIRALHAERGLTSLIVTHNEKIASGCDEVWQIEGGHLVTPEPRSASRAT